MASSPERFENQPSPYFCQPNLPNGARLPLGSTLHSHKYSSISICVPHVRCWLRAIRTGEDARALQEDLNKLSVWSNKRQMSLNITSCSLLNVRTHNPLHMYSLDSTTIGRTDCERDLEEFVNSDQKLRK